MKRFTLIAVLCAVALGGCQFSLPSNVAPTVAVDVVGTTNALIQTGQAQTLTAQPSPTLVPPTFTFTPVLAEASPTPTLVAATTNTDTPVPNLTTTFTPTSVPTSTGAAVTATATSALGQTTASPTLGIRTYGTLPPLNRPYTQATLINRSRSEAYISLQIETDQGYTIIEYPVKKFVRVKIPTGDYTYVVWVGGRQFVGFFHASDLHEPVITIFRDKIVIK